MDPIFKPFRQVAAEGVLFFRKFGGVLDWVHPNARGHKIAAAALFTALVWYANRASRSHSFG